MNIKNILIIGLALLISVALLFFTPKTKVMSPQSVYRVYLAGKSVGLIEDKEDLDQYIDKEQQSLNSHKVYLYY